MTKEFELIFSEGRENYHKALHLAHCLSSINQNNLVLPAQYQQNIEKIERTSRFLNVPFKQRTIAEVEEFLKNNNGVEVSYPKINSNENLIKYFNLQSNEKYLSFSTGESLKFTQLSGKSVVAAIGESSIELALTLGLFSKRAVVYFENVSSFLDLCCSSNNHFRSIYIVPPKNFSLSSVENILCARDKTEANVPIGFFYNADPIVAEMFLIKSLVFSRFRESTSYRSTLYYPLYHRDLSLRADDLSLHFGKTNSKELLLHDLQEPSEFLFINTHSNGLNAYLGDLVLCARKGFSGNHEILDKAPACFLQDICNRTKSDDVRVGILELKAKVFCLSACYATLMDHSVYDSSTQLIYQVASSSYSACVISTYSSVMGGRQFAAKLLKSISDNKSIGRAIADSDKSSDKDADSLDNRLILHGDPEYLMMHSQPIEKSLNSISEISKFVNVLDEIGFNNVIEGITRKHYSVPTALTREYFFKLDYYRSIVSAYRMEKKTHSERLLEALDCLSLAIDDAWQSGAVLNQMSRRSNKIDAFTSMEIFRASYSKLHESWFKFFNVLISTQPTGMRVRTNIAHHSELKIENSDLYECNYCHEKATRKRSYSYSMRPEIEAKWKICLNCGEVFDGFDCFNEGLIKCSSDWEVGKPQKSQLEVKTSLSGHFQYFMALFVEPFKWQEIEVPSSITKGMLKVENGLVKLDLQEITIPPFWPSGVHYLGALILLNENFLVLRRPIQIKSGKKRGI